MEEILPPLFRVKLFGAFTLNRLSSCTQRGEEPWYEPVPEKAWRSRSAACSLLKLLLCRARRRAPRDLLIEALWPDVPVSNANHCLDTALSVLRTLLRPRGKASLLSTVHSGGLTLYHLPPQSVLWVDVDAFLEQVALADQAEARGSDPLPSLETAWQLGREVFLEDDLYCSWAQARRQTINATRQQILHRLAAAYFQRHRPQCAETLLLQALEEEPTNEDALARLMEVLERQGRRHEALQRYQHLSALLADEQDAVPGKPLQDLAHRLATEPLPASPVPVLTRASSSSGLLLADPPLSRPERFAPAPAEEEAGSSSLSIPPELFLDGSLAQGDGALLYRIIRVLCDCKAKTGRDDVIQKEIDGLIRREDMTKQHNTSQEASVSRRKALTLIAGLPAFLLAPELFDQSSPARTEEFLAHSAASLTVCWHLMKGSDFPIVEQVVSRYLPVLKTLASHPSRFQSRAAMLAVQGHLLAGLVSFHRNDLLGRQQHCQQAVALSQGTQDQNLQVAALSWSAITAHYRKQPARALQIYQQALVHLPAASPLVQACTAARAANVYAQCGREQEALRCLRLAQEVFPSVPEQDPGYLYIDGGPYTLMLWEGLTALELGHPKEAWQALNQVEQLPPGRQIPERIRLEILNHRAEAAVALGDQERLCADLVTAATGARRLGSERRYQEAFGVYTMARLLWPQEARIKELQEVFVR